MELNRDWSNRHKQLLQAAAYLKPILRRSVTPVSAHINGAVKQLGTGTFFRVADDSFLITAGHVWKIAKERGLAGSLSVFTGISENEEGQHLIGIPMKGDIVWADDPFDVAVIALEPSMVEQLRDNCFLRLGDVRLKPAKGTRLWVYGFPAESVVHDTSTDTYRFNEFILSTSMYDKEVCGDNVNPAFHFFMHLDRNDSWALHESSEPRLADLPFDLGGISGCPIWQTLLPKDKDAGWNPEAHVVGVETSYYRGSSLIKATPWGAVAQAIYMRRPTLQTALEINFGTPGHRWWDWPLAAVP